MVALRLRWWTIIVGILACRRASSMAFDGHINHGISFILHGDLHCTADEDSCVCLWLGRCVARLWSYVVARLIPLIGHPAFLHGVGP